MQRKKFHVLQALEYFIVYIGSTNIPVAVLTDHNQLTVLSCMYNMNQCLMLHWSLIVHNYNLEIFHKEGAESIVADALVADGALIPPFLARM